MRLNWWLAEINHINLCAIRKKITIGQNRLRLRKQDTREFTENGWWGSVRHEVDEYLPKKKQIHRIYMENFPLHRKPHRSSRLFVSIWFWDFILENTATAILHCYCHHGICDYFICAVILWSTLSFSLILQKTEEWWPQ